MAFMRPIARALVLVVALGCPKGDDSQPSPSVGPAPTAMGEPSFATATATTATTAAAPRPAAARSASSSAAERRNERETLVAHLRQDGIAAERVLSAMAKVPRHAFVPESHR